VCGWTCDPAIAFDPVFISPGFDASHGSNRTDKLASKARALGTPPPLVGHMTTGRKKNRAAARAAHRRRLDRPGDA